jgi:hypothetical protein
MNRQLAFVVEALIQRIRDFPNEALNELFIALEAIEEKYGLIEPLSEEDRKAIRERIASLDRGEAVPMEDLEIFKRLKNYDRAAAGKDAFADAVGRVQRRPGEEQGGIAHVIFALLHEYQFDIPPPPKDARAGQQSAAEQRLS